MRGQESRELWNDIRELAIILLSPELMIVACIYQFDTDRKIVAALHDPTRQDRTHTKFAPNRRRVGVFSLVTKDGTARDHAEIR